MLFPIKELGQTFDLESLGLFLRDSVLEATGVLPGVPRGEGLLEEERVERVDMFTLI